VRARVAKDMGAPPRRAVFGRPVNFAFGDGPVANRKAQHRLEAAAKQAGFEEVVFEYEPIGASLDFGRSHGLAAGGHVFVFDFGGGTLDVAVVQIAADGAQTVLATGGVGIGGDHFDQAIFNRTLLPWFGKNTRWGAQRLSLPAHLMDALCDWQNIPALSSAQNIQMLRDAQRDCTDPLSVYALEELITKGYGYDVFERLEAAKVRLSTGRFSAIDFAAGAIDIWQPVTRTQFEGYIASERRQIAALIHATLAQAGLAASDIARVVRTGGSSSIPCFVTLLRDVFGDTAIVEQDLFTGVASGLALKAREIGLNAS
jgi:hypothetical chaperone protein